jgi:hypothetical protein
VNEERKPLESAASLKRFKDKKPRRARALALLTLVAAAGFALFLLIRPQAAPEGDVSKRVALIARDKTLLKSITVAVPDAKPYTLINQNDYDLSDKNDQLGKEYAVEGDPDFAVSTQQVLPMERYASDLSAEDVAARAPSDLDQYGLKAPLMTVTIGYRDNAKETLRFCGAVPTGSGYYLERAGDKAVYIVADSVYEAFHRALDELKQTEQEKADLAAAQAADEAQEPSATGDPGATPAAGLPSPIPGVDNEAETPAPGATGNSSVTNAPVPTGKPAQTAQPAP